MLDELHVKDIALIQEASISCAPGLTVLTGETGAGKTALLSALGLVRGERGDVSVVLDGASEALAEARIADGGKEHILKRRLSAKGRSRCTVDGEMATVSELAQAAASVRVHGQREQANLLDAATQTAYLDACIDSKRTHVAEYVRARDAYMAAKRELDAYLQAKEKGQRELEFMRYTLEQIEAVQPMRGEYEELTEELPRLQHGEQLAQAVHNALQALSADGGALDTVGTAVRGLEREAGIDAELDACAETLAQLEAQLADTVRDLHSYAQDVSYDPQRLAGVLDRLEELSGLMRRFGPDMDSVFSTWEEAAQAVETASGSPAREKELRNALAQALEVYRASAKKLSELRHEQAPRLCAQLANVTEELAMKGSSFEFAFEEMPFERWTQGGGERIELLYSPAPAAALKPLSRIASGGELSRISLALECIYRASAGADAVQTLVFDEVDQGVGGATGAAVARRLAQLARHVQVVVVTHLPQVAAGACALRGRERGRARGASLYTGGKAGRRPARRRDSPHARRHPRRKRSRACALPSRRRMKLARHEA